MVHSARWDCIRLGRLFTLMLVVRMGVFPVLTIRSRRHDGWKGWWRRIWLIPSIYVNKCWSWHAFVGAVWRYGVYAPLLFVSQCSVKGNLISYQT